MVTQNLTKPGGGAWLPGGGGHFWVSDGALGLCETVPASLSTTKCNGTAKGGQVVYDSAKSLVYQADATTKTNQVMRFPYTAANDGLGGAATLSAPNLTAVGGGSGGGRAQGIALMTGPDGAQRLYVGYLKSGDIMQVLNPSGKDASGATVTPKVTKIGTTSDGKGVNGLQNFTWTDAAGTRHDDLYIAELGGNGLSVIKDVDGTAGRPACGSGATPCNASTVANATGAALFSFPGGLTSDGQQLFIADAPLNTPSKVLAYNPTTGAQSVVSTDVSPAYKSTFDGNTRSQYQNVTGLALNTGNADLYVADDPSFPLATPVNAQGHLWKVAGNATQPVVTAVSPSTGSTAGGEPVTITGTNLVDKVAGSGDPTAFGTTVSFGSLKASGVTCSIDGTSCTVTTPKATGAGVADVRVTNIGSQTSAVAPVDQFTFTTAAAPAPGAPTVTNISPSTGLSSGGTSVKITGSALANTDGTAAVSFGTNSATGVNCLADGSSCTAVSPAGTDGTTVDVEVTTTLGTSASVAADKFTYQTPVGALYSSGITAPKGGVTWVPDSKGGHYWVSDHANGFCRLDPVPGTTVTAPNYAACDPGFTIGSPGQAVYDPTVNSDGTHNIYIPDNAVRSPGVWRLTFDPTTATVSSPTAMAPNLLDNLKTNSLALDGSGANAVLYVGDLVDGNIRRINGIEGDPRLQTVDTVAQTQAQKVGAASRGINGTMAILDHKLFLPENNAATYVDLSAAAACGSPTPCSTTTVNFLNTPAAVFVAGIATDAKHGYVYISESPGAANATIYRFDESTITPTNPGGSAGIVYVKDGKVPAAGTPNATVYCSLTCTRPADPGLTPGGTTGFPFAQGLFVDPTSSDLFITEDVTAGARSARGHAWEVPFVQ
jgi:hypothetical protein